MLYLLLVLLPICLHAKTIQIKWGFSVASPIDAKPGDILEFTWSGTHNVYKKASATCGMVTDADKVGDTSGVMYTIKDSSENTLFFECNIGTHCVDDGMNLQVNVADSQEPCIIAVDCERGYELVGAKDGCGGKCEKVKHDCKTKEVWTDEKRDWCCEHEELGCPSPKYDPCNGKTDGDKCTLCDLEDTTCVETQVVKRCKSGKCSHAHTEPCIIAVDCKRGYELVGAKDGCGGTCEKVKHDCRTREVWTDEKTKWCCEQKGLGCKDSPEPHRAAESDNSSMVTTPESDVSTDKPIDIIEVIFGNSVPRVEACSEDTVRVIWNGTHDLIETKTADCNSEALEVWEDTLQPNNYEKDFTVLGGKYAGHTRYFKCSVHCTATAARFEITCPSDGKVGASSAPTNDTGSNLEIPAILVALCVSGCLGAIILGCLTRRSKKGYVAMQADVDDMDFVNDDQKLEETPLKWLY